MSDKYFFDTNILLYALDRHNKKKQKVARELIVERANKGEIVISTQVVQEGYVAATQKLGIDPRKARRWVEQLENFDVAEVKFSYVKQAIDCAILNQLSFWDALIITTAEATGCLYLYSEDMNHGQAIHGVKIVNPFLSQDRSH